ncbi:hypothetical protein DACRYDRAFT_21763 [Dacryopinax primogenitus]|uniref:Uncharacterized protein n=1 Tax=Dacryopinax primogenitus (strain DJM 731) TaxID=1858805 RepID=M5FXQ3_DACPD|nr:uncharacterized protein DACRYDRAFT_21763 [Dacryopinax primogenitus]EJU02811.1 hypothetical protein DACRYDRAFT_21763 [Dacryopinax primogenitus]
MHRQDKHGLNPLTPSAAPPYMLLAASSAPASHASASILVRKVAIKRPSKPMTPLRTPLLELDPPAEPVVLVPTG